MKKLNENKFKELVMKQFEIAGIEGVTFEDLQADDKWLEKYECTKEQNKQWIDYLKKEIKGYILKGRLDKEADRFNLNYGLKINEI